MQVTSLASDVTGSGKEVPSPFLPLPLRGSGKAGKVRRKGGEKERRAICFSPSPLQ